MHLQLHPELNEILNSCSAHINRVGDDHLSLGSASIVEMPSAERGCGHINSMVESESVDAPNSDRATLICSAVSSPVMTTLMPVSLPVASSSSELLSLSNAAAASESSSAHSLPVLLSSPSLVPQNLANARVVPHVVLGHETFSKRRRLGGPSTNTAPSLFKAKPKINSSYRSTSSRSAAHSATQRRTSAFVSNRKVTLRSAANLKSSVPAASTRVSKRKATLRSAANLKCSVPAASTRVSKRKATLRSAANSKSSAPAASTRGRNTSSVLDRRASARLAACSMLPALAIHLISAPVQKTASARALRVCTVNRTKNSSRSVAAGELAAFYARKTCEVCSQTESQPKSDARQTRRGMHTCSSGRKDKVIWLCCSFCDDTFHSTCLPKDFDLESDGGWICPTCSVDSELKRRSMAARPRPGNVDSTRPSRSFSSAWLKSCSFTASASSPNRNFSSDVDSILIQPPQSLVASSLRSYVQSASLLTGLSVSVIAKAALKLPRFGDRNESQRADARRALALAMKEKCMSFDDDLSYPWPDCSQVCFSGRIIIRIICKFP
jgi:hypothetical protein